MQKRLSEQGFWVYDFALPMLTLQVRQRRYKLCLHTLQFPLLRCMHNATSETGDASADHGKD
jgi:hypothetical protein